MYVYVYIYVYMHNILCVSVCVYFSKSVHIHY